MLSWGFEAIDIVAQECDERFGEVGKISAIENGLD